MKQLGIAIVGLGLLALGILLPENPSDPASIPQLREATVRKAEPEFSIPASHVGKSQMPGFLSEDRQGETSELDDFRFLLRTFRKRADFSDHMEGVRAWLLETWPVEDAERKAARYARYLESEMELARYVMMQEQPRTADALLARLDEVRQLREDLLGPEFYRDLFGDEYERTCHRVRRRAIVMDPDLAAADKHLRLEELKAEWNGKGDVPTPASAHEQYRELLAIHSLDMEEMESDAERMTTIRQLRSACFDYETVSRMEKADWEFAETARREARLEREEAAIRNLPDLSAAEREDRIKALQEKTLGPDAAVEWRRRQELARVRNGFIKRRNESGS